MDFLVGIWVVFGAILVGTWVALHAGLTSLTRRLFFRKEERMTSKTLLKRKKDELLTARTAEKTAAKSKTGPVPDSRCQDAHSTLLFMGHEIDKCHKQTQEQGQPMNLVKKTNNKDHNCHPGVSHVERYLSHRFIGNYINGQRNSKANVVFRMSNFHRESLAF